MEIEDIKIRLEELEIEPSLIDEIVEKLNQVPSAELPDDLLELQGKLSEEKDWKKRIVLGARIISHKLDNDLYT